ncbi:hypothetical protein [Engelhardtia mirabilis]|uniref:Uncharacterized protein n=1 Tax=Engelhardtia mirabilis TaxID=2528011 RepID=A0A518BQJ5_9BACT|nr:hypothetical protein Pla133_43490 [Planctomycetes bacterium Pla133]QDV03559.1 hypothetical protein Pla86_43480 [Planctomycetes bacterium Pla86]
MRLLIYFYIGIYAAAALQSIREDVRFEAPRWKAGLSTVANALGVAGMLFYVQGVRSPELALGWRWVVALIAVATAVQLRYTFHLRFRRVLPEGDPADGQLRSLVWTSIGLGLLASAPFFWMNLSLAFGPTH